MDSGTPIPARKRHGDLPVTNQQSDAARHELRWQTVKWVLKHCHDPKAAGWGRPSLDSDGPEGYTRYLAGDPWAMRPATVTMDLRAICKRLDLWRDMLNPDLANSDRTFEGVQNRRIETWTTTMFEDLTHKAREAGWCGEYHSPAYYEAFAAFKDVTNHEPHMARLQARADMLAALELEQIVDEAVPQNEHAGGW